MTQPLWSPDAPNTVIEGDNLPVLQSLPSESFQLICIDPPFNTGRQQRAQRIRTVRDAQGGRIGFKGQTYQTIRGALAALGRGAKVS